MKTDFKKCLFIGKKTLKIVRRLICLLLVLSMLFTSGMAEILAAANQIQETETQSETYPTIPLTELSDMFVTERTDPTETEPTETESHNFSYEILNDNTCRVTGYSGDSWETLEIPDTLDGVLCTDYEYDLDTGRLTVPVTAASGTLRFCLKPLRYEALTSYTRLVCTDGAGRSSVVVVAVNSLMPALNITAQEETSASSVSVSGLAVPEAEVSLYLDGTFVKTVRANKVGDYCADVPLNNPADGREYIITAEAADRTGAMAVAQTNVTYRYTAPELLDFTMIYGSRKLSLLELQGTRPVLTFTTGRFRFEVNFTNAEHLEAVYVVSTHSNVKKYLQEHWKEALGMFVAEGYFDPNDHFYISGALSLEYVTEREKISFDQSVEFNPQGVYDTLPQVRFATGAWNT